jgi:hypothetical protein
VKPKDAGTDFDAYGIPGRELPDPVSRALDGLLDQISRLQARVGTLEGEVQAHGPHLNGQHLNGQHLNGSNGKSPTDVSSDDAAASAVYELRNHI